MEVILQLTRDCNLACRYCYQLGKHRAGAGMSVETAIEAVRFAIGMRPSHVAVSFFGGEPLLNRGTIEAVVPRLRELEAEHGVRIAAKVSTNGTLLDDSFARFAKVHGLFVSLSTDGSPRVQDEGRPYRDAASGGSSAAVERALSSLVSAKTPFCSYSVITPQNARYLTRSVDWLFERGSRVLITGLDFAADWDEASIETLGEQYGSLARRYVRWTRKGVKFYLAPFDGKIAAHTRGDSSRQHNCAAGVRQFAVDPDGAIYPCVEFLFDPRFVIGDLKTGLDANRRRAVNQEFAGERPEECGDCGIRTRCASACACLDHRTTGKLREVDALVCAHEKKITLAADRMGALLWKKRDKTFIDRQYNPAHHELSAVEDWIEEVMQ